MVAVAAVVVTAGVFWPSGDDGSSGRSQQVSPTAETTTGSEPGGAEEAAPEDIAALDILLGDCWNPPGVATGDEDVTDVHEVETIEVVACSDEHQAEAYAVFHLEDGPWPGQETVADDAESGCLDRWEEFVGIPYQESSLDLYALFPLERSWNELGDREVVCSVMDPEGTTVGSLEGAAR